MVRNAHDLLHYFSLRVTGAGYGDVLEGCAKGTKGGLVQLVGKETARIGPIKSCLEMMKEDDEVWRKFLARLAGVGRYGGIGAVEREKLVLKDAKDVSTNLPVAGGGEGLRIRVLSLPQTIIERVSETDMERILSREEGWDVNELLSVDGLTVPGSSKTSLVFLTGWWKITTDTTLTPPQDFTGACVDLLTAATYPDPVLIPPTATHMYALSNIPSAFRKTPKGYVKESGESVGFLIPPPSAAPPSFEPPKPVRDQLDAAFKNFGNGIFKSALQKLIRFTPETIVLPCGTTLSGRDVMRYIFCKMRDSNGQFVPDIQRWVGGVESLAKRGAVSGFEDSDVSVDPKGVGSLLCGALLAQRVPSWKPPKAVQEQWLETLVKLYDAPKAVVYSIKEGLAMKPYALQDAENPLQAASALLDELRSFSGDLALTRYTAATKKLTFTKLKTRPKTMLLPDHAIDQHVNPNIVYLWRYPVGAGFTTGPPGAPFKPLLANFFEKVTGVNPRRIDAREMENDSFVKECRRVQRLYRTLLQTEGEERPVDGFATVRETVDTSWIAGMVGVVNVGKVNGVAMVVTIDVGDPLKLVAVRAPARGASDNMLHDAERQEEAKKRAKDILKKGVPMDKIPAPHPSLAHCKAFLITDDDGNPTRYDIKGKTGDAKPWDDARVLEMEIPLRKDTVEPTMENAIKYRGTGMEVGMEEKVKKILTGVEGKVLRRVLVYLSGNKNRFRMGNVSRDGGGTEGAVVVEDIAVFDVLMKMSVVCPVAVCGVRGHPFSFDVKNLPMLWRLRRIVTEAVQGKSSGSSSAWPNIDDKLKRVTMQHQNDALQDMIAAHNRSLHGSFLYIPPGMGKTLIVMLYIRWLALQSQLPAYVVYTLPKSAMKSVLYEIVALGMPVTVVRPIKSKQTIKQAKETYEGVDKDLIKVVDTKEMVKHRVMMVEHDDLRLCEESLTGLAGEGFLFINDEVHKTLATTTKRTSVALDLATLSQEFIALTGTPIISSSAYPLIGWLQRISPFTVTGQNFWVSANTMIAHTVATGVETHREEKTPEFGKAQLKAYLKKIPPAFVCQDLPGGNANPRPEDWREAANMCYDLCDEAMVEEVVRVVDDGVMVVVRDKAHQRKVVDMLLAKGVNKKLIFALGADSKTTPVASAPSIFLTSASVRSSATPPYKVAVVPVRLAEGYSLTYLTRFVTSVYPCNNSTREQLEARINRISQEAKKVYYTTYHCGVLTWIHANHMKAHDLATALKSMAKVVTADDLRAVTKSLQ